MRVFVTGATGFVGRNFLEWAVREIPDAEFVCLVRDLAKAEAQWANAPAALRRKIRWLAGDLLAPESFRQAIASAERIFHIAALVSLRNGPEFYRMNTEATRNLLEALTDSTSLERLVFVGSISAVDRPPDRPAVGPLTEAFEPHPNTDYGKSKLLAERAVVESGLPYSILRPSYIYGPHPRLNSSMDRLIHDVKNGKRYTRFPFPGQTSEVYAEDLAEMIWLASEHPATLNETFFVGNPDPVRISQVYGDLAAVLGVPHEPMEIRETLMPRYHRQMIGQQPDILMLRILFEDYFACDTAKWQRATGHQPRYGYREGMRRTVDWYRRQGLI